jgi:Cu(I)/Ag(I) efflux system membrane fusion protein
MSQPLKSFPARTAVWLLRHAGLAVFMIVFAAAGWGLRGWIGPGPDDAPGAEIGHTDAEDAQDTVWTCSMHPQIRQDKPGLCPICAMDLIPASTGGDEGATGPRQLAMSEAAAALLGVQTARAERRFATAEVRMVGLVDYDETRLAHITAWVPGRIERLYADYTGVRVQKGEHLADLFSPELLAAKDELTRARRALANVPAGAPQVLRDTAEATLEAVRAKLRRWGLTQAQIDRAAEEGVLSDRVTIYAPMGGTVVERSGTEGMYVDTGSRLYTIADLSVVWVMFRAYESDLPWLHYGQEVSFTAESAPGAAFEGRIAFIDPVLDPATRTVRVRVNAPNLDGRLKPGMFVRGLVRSQVATRGRVMDPGLAGKWISPMHPEIVKDGPGACDVCGMPLVRAEELGYVSADTAAEDKPLVIPVSAALVTGRRAVVYVEVRGAERPTFEGREIVLGPRAGGYYLVESGLEEGEVVVTHGSFKIDSELQIRAQPSMMQPEHEAAGALDDVPPALRAQLGRYFEIYLAAGNALAADDHEAAAARAQDAADVEPVDPAEIPEAHRAHWENTVIALRGRLGGVADAADMDAARAAYERASEVLIEAVRAFGLPPETAAWRVHCPMAFDFKGADWIQDSEEVNNPYFGSEMLRCGTVEENLGADSAAGHAHGGMQGNAS